MSTADRQSSALTLALGDCPGVAVAGDREPGPGVAPVGGDEEATDRLSGASPEPQQGSGITSFPVALLIASQLGEHDTAPLTSRLVSGFPQSASSWIMPAGV